MHPTSGNAADAGAEFIESSRCFLKQDFLPRLRRSIELLSEEDLWWRPNEASNSVGNLVLHMCGNLRQWVGGGTASTVPARDRAAEFAERGPMPKAELLARLEAGVEEADRMLAGVASGRLLERTPIQVYDVSRLQAVFHAVEHFSYHLGQILYVCKLRLGRDLKHYQL